MFLQVDAPAPELPGGYGMALVQTLLALLGVCVLAWVVLRALSQRGFAARAGGRIQVIERVHLDPKRTLWLLRVDEKELLVGAGDSGPPVLLGEIGETEREADAGLRAPIKDD